MNANFNRLGNSKNIYQGDAKKVLCVCSAGILRSPTAANVLHKEFGYNTRAAGISDEFALIPVDEVLVYWADEIVCMDIDQAQYIEDNFNIAGKHIFALGVPDRYRFMDEELQRLILKSYRDAANIAEIRLKVDG